MMKAFQDVARLAKTTRFLIALSVVVSSWDLTKEEKLEPETFSTLVLAVLAMYVQSRNMDKSQENGKHYAPWPNPADGNLPSGKP